jgi:four helix bundle protein
MRDEPFDFESLKVYQRALEYGDFVYRVTKTFPKEELFSLTDQFKRAATSICLNIAEGSGGSKAEFNQYLKIARRSTRECVAISEISYRQSYFNAEAKKQSRMFCTEISKMLSGLMKSL